MGIRSLAVAGAAGLFAILATPAGSGDAVAATRLIVQLRDVPGTGAAPDGRATTLAAEAGNSDRARRKAEARGLRVRDARALGSRMVGLKLATAVEGAPLAAALAALRADPEVQFADVDYRRHVRAVPSDPLYASQWYLAGTEPSATNFESAWDTTTGAGGTVVAVLDTGVRYDHPDLGPRLLDGYDFVSGESASSFVSANDGSDWDDDASDPGDWVSIAESESGPLAGCEVDRSSWHGTRVAAIIGAASDNGTGMAGGTWSGGVLPVRVLGKCGGYDSDIIAGMRWAAGLPVAGVPTNLHPAKVVNLSLGSSDPCSSAYVQAIDDLGAAGVLVVASAGNSSGPVEAPANCPGVMAVGGLRHVGTKVGYSSLGAQVAVSAPAGNCPDLDTTFRCSYSLVTADNTGDTVPLAASYTDDANYNIGTSFSAPIVSALAGLVLAVNDRLTPAEIIGRIQAGARPFPTDPALPTCPRLDPATAQCNCTTTTCGAGIADAPGALAEALRPAARIEKPDGTGAGEQVVLDGADSEAAPDSAIVAYAWSGVSGNPVFVGPTTGPAATVDVPRSGKVKVRLEVTDDAGRKDTRDVELGRNPDGGGGAVHPLALLALGLAAIRRSRRPAA